MVRSSTRLGDRQGSVAGTRSSGVAVDVGQSRVFSTIAGDLRMTELGPSPKIREKRLLFRRAMPCFFLQSTRRTPPWVSPIPRGYRPRSSSRAVEITSIGRVRNVASLALGIGSGPAPCMIWATWWGAGPVRSGSLGYPSVLPAVPGGPGQPRIDASRDHHRRFGAVSAADFRGLRCGGASGLSLPHPGRAEQVSRRGGDFRNVATAGELV